VNNIVERKIIEKKMLRTFLEKFSQQSAVQKSEICDTKQYCLQKCCKHCNDMVKFCKTCHCQCNLFANYSPCRFTSDIDASRLNQITELPWSLFLF